MTVVEARAGTVGVGRARGDEEGASQRWRPHACGNGPGSAPSPSGSGLGLWNGGSIPEATWGHQRATSGMGHGPPPLPHPPRSLPTLQPTHQKGYCYLAPPLRSSLHPRPHAQGGGSRRTPQ